MRFWAYAIEALRALAPAVGSASLAALGVSGTDPVEVVLPPLINELAALDARLVLVLDDYHLIESEEVHAGVAFLLAHLPPTFELAIATRHDPPLPLASLRAQGELLELRAAELRFNEAEAEQLLRAAVGEGLEAADVERLVVRTEGWAAGLYLAALSLAGRSDRSAFIEGFAGDDRHIVDYLGGEVLDDLEPDTRAFLLRTSILERLSAQLCDHLLEHDGRTPAPARDRARQPLPRPARRSPRVVSLPPPLPRAAAAGAGALRPGGGARPAPSRRGLARGQRRDRRCHPPCAVGRRRRGRGAAGCRAVADAVQPRRARDRRPLAGRPARGASSPPTPISASRARGC